MLKNKMFVKLNKFHFRRVNFLERFVSEIKIVTLELDGESFINRGDSARLRIRESPVNTIGDNRATKK